MQTGIWNGVTCSLWKWGFAPGPSLFEIRWLFSHLHQQGNALCSEGRAVECTSQGLYKRSERLKVQESLLFYSTLLYSKTTTIPNKKSSCSSATANQAILLGHWWFVWDRLVLLPCYALNWYLYLVHLEDTFQITAGVQTTLYDMVLAFPPSACGPAILSNWGSHIYSGIIIKQTPWTTLFRIDCVLILKLYEF